MFFNRLGEIRDRSFEQQRYCASGLNLITAATVLWNTVYLERGDYVWRSGAKVCASKFRPLRPLSGA